jgi:hypothetical protein
MPNVPNQYHLQGGGISVSYYPQGFGRPVEGRGRLIFVYQDAHRPESFYSDGQAGTYCVTELDGTAAFGLLPLVTQAS